MAAQLQSQHRTNERVERRFREVARISAGAIWELDASSGNGWWVDADGSLVNTGADGEDAGLDEFLDRIVPEDRPALHRAIIDTAESADSWRLAHRMQRPDGSLARVETQAMRLRDEETGQLLVIGGTRDVTEQRELEEQLRQAQRLESIGQLTGGVSHDFNNLLTVILGNTEMLQESLRDRPEELEMLAMVRSAADRGADLNRRLLAFARRQPLDPKVIDINELLRGLEPMLRRTLGEQLELTLRTAPDLWRSMLDPSQLESAILNLAINARDAIGDHGSLEIDTANVTLDPTYTEHFVDLLPGDYVRIDISDDGPGIPRELLDHVFEPFFTTKRDGAGLRGSGLSMVFGFVKQSGGHVRIYSEAGDGHDRSSCTCHGCRRGRTARKDESMTSHLRRRARHGDASCWWRTTTLVREPTAAGSLTSDSATEVTAVAEGRRTAVSLLDRRSRSSTCCSPTMVMPRRRHDRPRGGGGRAGEAVPDLTGALYLGLHRECHRPSRPARRRHPLPAEALHPPPAGHPGPRGTGPGDFRRAARNDRLRAAGPQDGIRYRPVRARSVAECPPPRRTRPARCRPVPRPHR
ncbi:MAG: ATP-binding protein [Gammaproteobacteria bacterium]|nr:ATP-binding protein [Gammaproteobacteria bacterium]